MIFRRNLTPKNVEPVVNPYGDATSEKRKGIFVTDNWSDEVLNYVNANNITALYFNSSRGWAGRDFSFLSKLSDIEELNIISSYADNIDAIEKMDNLVELSITAPVKVEVDFSKLHKLKKCYIYWWKGAKKIFDCSSLQSIHLDSIKNVESSFFEKLKNVSSLTISNSNIDEIFFLNSFSKLSQLELNNCKKICDYDAISNCEDLKKLSIRGAKTLSDINFVESLTELEILILSDCMKIDAIKPLAKLNKLKAFSFSGNTEIKDGDLNVLCVLPKLSMLMFRERRHYTHKLIKTWDWNNYEFPSKLLEEK